MIPRDPTKVSQGLRAAYISLVASSSLDDQDSASGEQTRALSLDLSLDVRDTLDEENEADGSKLDRLERKNDVESTLSNDPMIGVSATDFK